MFRSERHLQFPSYDTCSIENRWYRLQLLFVNLCAIFKANDEWYHTYHRNKSRFVQILAFQGQHSDVVVLVHQLLQVIHHIRENGSRVLIIWNFCIQRTCRRKCFHRFGRHWDPEFGIEGRHLNNLLQFSLPLKRKHTKFSMRHSSTRENSTSVHLM